MNKVIIYIFFIPLSIMLIFQFLPIIGDKFYLEKETLDNISLLLINFFLPFSMILGIVINVENDRKKTNLKRSAYFFSYFIFIPLVVIIFIYAFIKL